MKQKKKYLPVILFGCRCACKSRAAPPPDRAIKEKNSPIAALQTNEEEREREMKNKEKKKRNKMLLAGRSSIANAVMTSELVQSHCVNVVFKISK